MKTFYLITNVSGLTYWSYLGTIHNTGGFHFDAVQKYGDIYINDMGGFFTKDCIKKIHKTVTGDNFPPVPKKFQK